ncbi:hypothetical protein QWZ08_19455 [Ferruginibacter paludis]|uniref:hypothetical protein n=1 Tax=Ferruginibacter paludis TaxID=1310417 RepID=UPI0025B523ED|nr:hypothetical protein [Ferruginibacter paludis]MDN3657838.1 hypothetical protein [Ferruginibacter paludis]
MKFFLITIFAIMATFLNSCIDSRTKNSANTTKPLISSKTNGGSYEKNIVMKDSSLNLCELIKAEHPLNFGDIFDQETNMYYYDHDTDFVPGRTKFSEMFKIEGTDAKGNTSLGELKKTEESVSLTGLIDMAKTLQNQNYLPSNSYYYGIKMHYGLDKDSMIIIFEPIILKQMGTDSVRTVIDHLSRVFYRFDEKGNFQKKLRDTDVINFENQFQNPLSKIYITHDPPSRRDTHKFVKNLDDNEIKDNDVRYAFMPMQQIIRMYEDNGGDCNNRFNLIKFSFVINRFRKPGGFNKFQGKLHVVASYNLSKESFTKRTLKNNYNNFAGLGADYTEKCPTNCPQ